VLIELVKNTVAAKAREEGFRDAKWYLGFKQARIACIKAWSRLFALDESSGSE
jgi:hypothetical protein